MPWPLPSRHLREGEKRPYCPRLAPERRQNLPATLSKLLLRLAQLVQRHALRFVTLPAGKPLHAFPEALSESVPAKWGAHSSSPADRNSGRHEAQILATWPGRWHFHLSIFHLGLPIDHLAISAWPNIMH